MKGFSWFWERAFSDLSVNISKSWKRTNLEESTQSLEITFFHLLHLWDTHKVSFPFSKKAMKWCSDCLQKKNQNKKLKKHSNFGPEKTEHIQIQNTSETQLLNVFWNSVLTGLLCIMFGNLVAQIVLMQPLRIFSLMHRSVFFPWLETVTSQWSSRASFSL